MSKTNGQDNNNMNLLHIDHEVRIRMLEHLSSQINSKMNVSLTLMIGSIVIPVVLKWLGWV